MIKETVTKSNRPVVIIGVIIVVSLILYAVPEYFDFKSYRILFEIAIFFIALVAIYYNIRNRLSCYSFMIIENELIISKICTKRRTVILSINISEIVDVCKRSDKKFEKYTHLKKKYRFSELSDSSNDTIIVYKINKNSYYFAFAPSNKFLEALITRISSAKI